MGGPSFIKETCGQTWVVKKRTGKQKRLSGRPF